jgi:hypothetical protein
LAASRRSAFFGPLGLVLLQPASAWAQLPATPPTIVEEPAPVGPWPSDGLAPPSSPPPTTAIPPPTPSTPPALGDAPAPAPAPPPAGDATRTAAPTAPSTAPAPTPAKASHLTARPALEDFDEDDDANELEAEPRRRWYGWQTLIADGASTLLLLSSAAGDDEASETLVTMGLVGYEFAPGIVHFAHGNTGRGFGSFGLRLGMPLAGAFVGASAASGCDGFLCEAGGAAIGALVGMAGAIAIDAAVFAYDYPHPKRDAQGALRPLVLVSPRTAWLGFGGQL